MLLDFGSDTHFTTFIPMKFREPVQGEHYYLFGNPALIVDQYREGYVTGKDNMSPDEEGLEYFISHTCYLLSGPVVGGDSGSSIYALDGTLIGITTVSYTHLGMVAAKGLRRGYIDGSTGTADSLQSFCSGRYAICQT